MQPTIPWYRKPALLALAVISLAAVLLALTAPPRGGTPTSVPNRDEIPSGVGANVQLNGLPEAEVARQLAQAQADGFEWIRQRFSWAEMESEPGQFDWRSTDAVVDNAAQRGLGIIAVLDRAPSWAKKAEDQSFPGAPPGDLALYTSFAEAVAQRYRGKITAYEIWDEPNLGAHWGSDKVSPAAYTALLSAGFEGVKHADPDALVLAGGLAATTDASPDNLNDLAFLDGMYKAGAAPYFDALAAKPYGLWYEPDAPADAAVTNFARVALYYARMCAYGDGSKGIWAVEFGWNALPSDWQGLPSPWGTDTAEKQAVRAVAAVQKARGDWPWMGPMVWAAYRPQAAADDPVWGFALEDAQGNARTLARTLGALSHVQYAGPGTYLAQPSAAKWQGAWRFSPLGADIGKAGDTVEIAFYGTRIDLRLRPGDYWANLYATVDGQPAAGLPKDRSGKAYIPLYDPEGQPATVTVARGLNDGPHTLRLEAQGGWGQWALAGWTVYRESAGSPLPGNVLLAVLLALGIVTSAAARWWGDPTHRLLSAIRRWSAWPLWVAEGLGVALFLIRGPWWTPFIGLALWVLTAAIRMEVALATLAASLPFYLVYGHVLGRDGSLTLGLLLAAAAGAVLSRVAAWASTRRQAKAETESAARPSLGAGLSRAWRSLTSLDLAVMALVLVAGLSLTASEDVAVSLREWVQVILAAALFYALLRSELKENAIWVVDGLTAGATVIALVALGQFLTGSNLISAEGVQRARGLYGSPNNLALFLGRTFPIALCLGAFGRRRPWLYGAAAVFQFVGLFLTFSRGALLIGLPAVLLLIGLVRRGRILWATVGTLVVMALGLIPAAGTRLLSSLLQLGRGTAFVRLNVWHSAWSMIRDHPLRGVGLDNFLYVYRTRYILPSAWEDRNLSHPHNILLDWWTRLGILGVLVLAWLLAAFFAAAYRAYRGMHDATLRALTLGLAASMVDFLAHGLVDAAFFVTDLAMVFALTSALIVLLERRSAA